MTVLPSSPVWYQSRGIDSSHDGMLAFASRNLVYIFDLKDKSPVVQGILSGHSDKVTSCSFCPPIAQDQLLRLSSGAEDCTVKVWDVKQKLMLQEHSAHIGNKIVSIHWSPVNPSRIFSGDEKGFVVCWNLDNDTTQRYNPDGTSQLKLYCLTCSPHDENIVAVGYGSGAVSLMDINKNGNVIRKLRAHTNEIHGIVWMPFRNESLLQGSRAKHDEGSVNNSTDDYEGIIVTGSKDKTIKLWTISNGKCGRSLKVPTRVTKGKKVKEDVARLYTTVYWPSGSATKFISSGYNGDLVVWDLHPEAENLFTILASQGRDVGHQRIVFNICHGADPKTSIVSTSMDRQIIHYTIPELEPANCKSLDWVLPTLGGFVYSLAVSLQDPSTLAVGVGDGMIRIWKTRSPKSSYDITVLWEGIKEKVMALSWHPLQVGYLAFGTEDGKVGIYDVRSMKPPALAATYHLKSVYSLSWGPECVAKSTKVDKSERLNIYSCGGDGIIYQHFFQNIDADAINIDTIIESGNHGDAVILKKHSEVSWSNDGRLLGIGNDNGVIQIFSSPHLQLIVTIECHSKIVNCIVWKPNIDSVNDYEVATGSNNSSIHIHDLKNIFSDRNYTVGNEIVEPICITTPSKTLIGHLSRITALSYNSRNPVEIVSSCYDGTAQVWNTETEKPLFNFRGHHGRLMCAVWTTVTNSDVEKSSGVIYTGADDYTVHGWYAQDQEHTEPVKVLPDFGFGPKNKFQSKKKARQKKKNLCSSYTTQKAAEVKTTFKSPPSSGDSNDIDHDLEILLEQRKTELIATQGKDSATQEPFVPSSTQKLSILGQTISTIGTTCDMDGRSQAVNEDEASRRSRKKLKNLFPHAVALDNRKKSYQHQDCLKIVQWKMAQDLEPSILPFTPGDHQHLNLGFYTDRRAAFRMMKLESDQLQKEDFVEGCINIKLLMGDVVGALNEAADRGELTDQLVAMAPIAGQNFWRVIAYRYANQLLAEGHHMHAVQYLLVCDKLDDAVEALLTGKHYREAVALVRARFCDADPLLKKTLKMWAQKLKYGGSIELAAKCFASIGEFVEAANALSQRATCGVSTVPDSDIASLWAAASICKCAQKQELVSAYANRALSTVCCRTWDWEKNQEILLSYPNLQEYSFISLVHEAILSRLLLKSLVKETSSMQNSYTWDTDSTLPKKYSCFVESLLKTWIDCTGKCDRALQHEKVCVDVRKECTVKRNDSFTENKFLTQLSVEVAAAVYSCYGRQKMNGSCVDHQLVQSNETQHVEADWVENAMHSIDLIAKSSCGDLLKDELTDVICSVVNWCAISSETAIFGPDGDPSLTSAIKFLWNEASGQFDHLRTFLNSKLLPACR